MFLARQITYKVKKFLMYYSQYYSSLNQGGKPIKFQKKVVWFEYILLFTNSVIINKINKSPLLSFIPYYSETSKYFIFRSAVLPQGIHEVKTITTIISWCYFVKIYHVHHCYLQMNGQNIYLKNLWLTFYQDKHWWL